MKTKCLVWWCAMSMFLIAGFESGALAEEIILPENGQVEIKVTYKEPTKNDNAEQTPLTDLARCFGTIDLKGDLQDDVGWSLPASSPAGGGELISTATIALTPEQAAGVTELRWTGQCEDDKNPPNVSTPPFVLVKPITLVQQPDTTPPLSPTVKVTVIVSVTIEETP